MGIVVIIISLLQDKEQSERMWALQHIQIIEVKDAKFKFLFLTFVIYVVGQPPPEVQHF